MFKRELGGCLFPVSGVEIETKEHWFHQKCLRLLLYKTLYIPIFGIII